MDMNLQKASELFEQLALISLQKGAFTDFESAFTIKQAVEFVKTEALKQQVNANGKPLEKVN